MVSVRTHKRTRTHIHTHRREHARIWRFVCPHYAGVARAPGIHLFERCGSGQVLVFVATYVLRVRACVCVKIMLYKRLQNIHVERASASSVCVCVCVHALACKFSNKIIINLIMANVCTHAHVVVCSHTRAPFSDPTATMPGHISAQMIAQPPPLLLQPP